MISADIRMVGSYVQEFLRWYFLIETRQIVRSSVAYLAACAEIFSFSFLLRTLFAPWKQIREESKGSGLNIGNMLQTLSLNMVSRGIGFIIRVFTLVIFLAMFVFLVLLSIGYLLLWLIFPLLFLLGVLNLFTIFF